MVSTGIQGFGLSDELLRRLELEQGRMALAMMEGKPADSPIHGGIVLTWTWMLEQNSICT